MSVSYDAAGSGAANDATSKSWTHVVGAGDNTCLIVCLQFRSAGVSACAVTYNGEALTQFITYGATLRYHEIWYKVNPATGSNTVAVSWTGSAAFVGGSLSFAGVNQGTPIEQSSSTIVDSTTANRTVTSSAGEIVVGFVMHLANEATAPGAGETERWDSVASLSGTSVGMAGYTQPGEASTSIDPTWATSSTARITAFNVNEAILLNVAGTLGLSGTRPTWNIAFGTTHCAGVLTPTGANYKDLILASMSALAGTLSLSGAAAKDWGRILEGTVSFAGSVVKNWARTFAGTLILKGAASGTNAIVILRRIFGKCTPPPSPGLPHGGPTGQIKSGKRV